MRLKQKSSDVAVDGTFMLRQLIIMNETVSTSFKRF
jgi:hypothetical protein